MKDVADIFPWILLTMLMFGISFIWLTPSSSQSFIDPLWESVHTPEGSAEMMRISVPDGWIVTYRDKARGIVYVPDEKHEWKRS